MKRRVARALIAWRTRLLHRRRYGRLVLECVDGLPLVVLPHVFNPKLLRSGEFLAQQLGRSDLLPRNSTVLDLGTGSGVAAIAAARTASAVVAVDINPDAVRCTRINSLLNSVECRVDARHGDLFEPVAGERFDVVLFNPPYYRGTPRDNLDFAWRSPDVIERFASDLSAHLTPGGHALLVLSTDGESPAFLNALEAQGLQYDAVARRDFVNEEMCLYRVSAAC
jgi:release factor glutamine methyltransferase